MTTIFSKHGDCLPARRGFMLKGRRRERRYIVSYVHVYFHFYLIRYLIIICQNSTWPKNSS